MLCLLYELSYEQDLESRDKSLGIIVIFWICSISVGKHTLAAGLIQHNLSTSVHLCRLPKCITVWPAASTSSYCHKGLYPGNVSHNHLCRLFPGTVRQNYPWGLFPWNCEPELAIFDLSFFCQFVFHGISN